MPRRDGPVVPMETLSIERRRAEPDHCQEHWYHYATARLRGMSVLDVGAGTGYGLDILQAGGATPVFGIDPQPLRDYIAPVPIADVASASYDAVLAVDVIEHVEDDRAFLADLLRVARRHVFISTPNWNHWRCTNPHHFREYTPEELAGILSGRRYDALQSDSHNRVHGVASLIAVTECNMAAWIDL